MLAISVEPPTFMMLISHFYDLQCFPCYYDFLYTQVFVIISSFMTEPLITLKIIRQIQIMCSFYETDSDFTSFVIFYL